MSLPSLYIFSHIFSISDVHVLSIHFNHKKNSQILLSVNQRNKQRHAHHIISVPLLNVVCLGELLITT